MELLPVGRTYNFMRLAGGLVPFSVITMIAAVVMLFVPGPRLGTDFRGGTEIEVAFTEAVGAGAIRDAVTREGFSNPDVIKIDDATYPNHYLLRVQEVSTFDEQKRTEIAHALCHGDGLPEACSPEVRATELKFSPGGDKISVRYANAPDLDWVKRRMADVRGIELRSGPNNPLLQSAQAHKVEIQIKSKGDQLMDALRSGLGEHVVPEQALRVEWIGPKAGAQLRDAAIKSIIITLVLITAYIAFRFDVRFAPGAVISLMHDALVTVGMLILLGREINLTTVAAVLTIIGFSVNDTVVVYDRVRENLGKLRGTSFKNLINLSLSEMLSRTLLTSLTAILSLVCFFAWGTGTLKEFALTLIIGFTLGVYSSIYVALPLTEWLDRRFFAKVAARPRRA